MERKNDILPDENCVLADTFVRRASDREMPCSLCLRSRERAYTSVLISEDCPYLYTSTSIRFIIEITEAGEND